MEITPSMIRKKVIKRSEKVNDKIVRIKDWARYMFINTKTSAREKGKEFNITLEDIIIPDVCPICKENIVLATGHREPRRPSLDRKDNSKGYIKGNINVICDKCNRMKNNASPEELINFSMGMLEFFQNETLRYKPKLNLPMPKGVNVLLDLWLHDKTVGKLSVGKELSIFLVSLAKELGMTPIEGTDQYCEMKVPDKDLTSVTASVMLLESHICLHTWRELNYVRLEISTCKEIDHERFKSAVDYIVYYFEPQDINLLKQAW